MLLPSRCQEQQGSEAGVKIVRQNLSSCHHSLQRCKSLSHDGHTRVKDFLSSCAKSLHCTHHILQLKNLLDQHTSISLIKMIS